MNSKRFRYLVRNLRKRFPLGSPVTVVRRNVSAKTDPGHTFFNGRTFWIRVKKNQDWQGQVDSLMHEWAHAVAIEMAYNHKNPWSDIYGEIYTFIEGI